MVENKFVSELDKIKVGDSIPVALLNPTLNQETLDAMYIFEKETGKHAVHNGKITGQWFDWVIEGLKAKLSISNQKLDTIRKIIK